MIECEIPCGEFTQGGINSSGENYDTTSTLRTDFAEIPRGLQSVSVSLAVRRKIWSSSNQEYYYSDTTSGTAYVCFYGENSAFIGREMIYNSAKSSVVNFFNYLNAKYVRFSVNLTSANIYPDDSHDTTSSYYFLDNFLTICSAVRWEYDENSKLIHEDLKIASEKNFVKPYPKVLWRFDENNELINENFTTVTPKAIVKPYPKALWRVDEKFSPDLPYHEVFPLEKPTGAFSDVSTLKYVYIPESVRKIGRFAFSGTSLESVKIHPDCEFFETSFPENCIVSFYD